MYAEEEDLEGEVVETEEKTEVSLTMEELKTLLCLTAKGAAQSPMLWVQSNHTLIIF